MKKIFGRFNRISFRILVLLSVYIILVFIIINYVNFHYFANKMESCIRDQAIQSSNLIKQSTHITMLRNQRDDLSSIIKNLAKVAYIEGIRIYNKQGVITFSGDTTEVHQTISKTDEQCIFCHASDKAKGTIPIENRFRRCPNQNGYRVVGLINPIENEPVCYTAECHAHSEDEKILGLLDIKMSLKKLDKNKEDARNKSFIFFGIISLLTGLVFARIIRKQIKNPVSKLMNGTQQVADLNLDYKIDIQSSVEMNTLANSFNKMTHKLKETQDELQKWSHTLEDRVKEKTKELKQAQDQLIMAEKLASMGKLAATVAHEINNPLSGILTYSKLILKNLKTEPNKEKVDQAIDQIEIIRDESKRCGDIVKNLLIFSKKPFGKTIKEDLREILKKSQRLVEHSIEMKNIKMVTELPDEPAPIICDPAALEQMTVAMLINAIEATSQKQGKISIRLEKEEQKKQYRLEISDNGSGIDKDALPHIFEPFFSTKDNEKSVGLGLAVVYGIIERHQGSIDVKSEKDKGTTFIIRLPEE